MTTSSLFHTDIQRLWKHSPFKVPADTPPSNASNQYEHMILTFTAIITWTNLHTYTRENYNNNKVDILSHTIPFPSSTSNTHIQKQTLTHARTHRIWSSPLLGLWCPESLNRRSNRKSSMFALTWLCVCLDLPTLWTSCPHNDRKTWTPLLQRFFEEFKWVWKKSNKCVPRGSIDPDTEKNIIYEKKQHFFSIQNLTQSRKDAYSNEGLRLQNALNAKNTHTHTHRHTHTHTHTQHAHMVHIPPIDIHYNINNVSAGKLISFWLFDLS